MSASTLPPGYRLEQDAGQDWWLHGPPDVVLFVQPGEPWLLDAHRKTEEQALHLALADLDMLKVPVDDQVRS